MELTDLHLRISAQRALLGSVCEGVRLVTVTKTDDLVAFRAVLSTDHHPEAEEELRCAFTEIIADFPDAKFEENYTVSDQSLPNDNIFEAGWVFARYEPEMMVVN